MTSGNSSNGAVGAAANSGDVGDVFSSRAFLVTKHSWKGKYRRIFSLGPRGVQTLNPASMEATNQWSYQDVVSILPTKGVAATAGEYQLVFRKGSGSKKTDSMRFSSDHRAQIVTDALRHHDRFAEKVLPNLPSWFCFKYHWSEQRVAVLLQAGPHALHQIDPNSRRVLASYFFKDIRQLFEVTDYPGGFVVQVEPFGRLHLFAAEARAEILQRVAEHAANFVGVNLERPKQVKFDAFVANKFGKFR
jgi:DnaJ family protein C protein 13